MARKDGILLASANSRSFLLGRPLEKYVAGGENVEAPVCAWPAAENGNEGEYH